MVVVRGSRPCLRRLEGMEVGRSTSLEFDLMLTYFTYTLLYFTLLYFTLLDLLYLSYRCLGSRPRGAQGFGLNQNNTSGHPFLH